jgi:2-oxoglutarate dehydrogenase E2 component (dihydrolipoamide succinyltransferase)
MEFRKAHLEAFQKKYNIKFGFMSAFVKAAAYALQDQPVVNAVIDGTEIIYRDYVDISVAVATPKVNFWTLFYFLFWYKFSFAGQQYVMK